MNNTPKSYDTPEQRIRMAFVRSLENWVFDLRKAGDENFRYKLSHIRNEFCSKNGLGGLTWSDLEKKSAKINS